MRYLSPVPMVVALAGWSCASEPVEPEIVRVEVRMPNGSAPSASWIPAGESFSLDIFVEPAFALDFDPRFGEEGPLTPGAQPSSGAMRPTGDGAPVELTRVALRNPRQVFADVPALEPGEWRLVIDDGRGGELEWDEPIRIRARPPTGRELHVAGLPDAVFADECFEIEVGFVDPDDDSRQFLAPPVSPTDNEILIELVDFDDGLDRTADGFAVTAPGGCGRPSIAEPAARISPENPTARWLLRGRRPGAASFGVGATRVDSGEFVDAISSVPAIEVRGKVEISTRASLWTPGSCQAVRWFRRHPVSDDAFRPALDLELVVAEGNGESVEPRLFADPECTQRSTSISLDRDQLTTAIYVQLDEVGTYELGGRVIWSEVEAEHVVLDAAIEVVASLPLGSVTVRAPPVVATGIPVPVILEAPSPTACELSVETGLGLSLLPDAVPVEVTDRELVWVTPTLPSPVGPEASALVRCREPDRQARPRTMTIRRCSGLGFDPSALRLDLSNRAPTVDDPSTEVALLGATGASSVLQVFGDLDAPLRFRLAEGSEVGATFRWEVPLVDRLERVTAIVRDEQGCPAMVEEVVYPGADPDRVIEVGPGRLDTALAGVDLRDSSPLVVVFTPETIVDTVFVDGGSIGRIESELVVLGPGAGALASLSNELILGDDAIFSRVDLHGAGRVVAEGFDFWLRDAIVREDVELDLRETDARLGPRVDVRSRRAPALRLSRGVIERSRFRGGPATSGDQALIELEDRAEVFGNVVSGLTRPWFGSASDGDDIVLEMEFNTVHRASLADGAALPSGSWVRFVGGILSRLDDAALDQLDRAPFRIEGTAIIGWDVEPSVCASSPVHCKPDDIFPIDPVPPEWLSYAWCDDVDPGISERDKTGFGAIRGSDGGRLRYYGEGYDYGHREYPVSTPGQCF